MKTAALFVDDEPNILSGLKRMLRVMRDDLDFHFAEGGREALEILANHHIDIIVSDMRMPGMDGAALLAAVQESYPHVIRIMLTGQADEQSMLRTVGVVHQLLAKPINPEILKQVLLRACALRDVMKNGLLKSLVSSLGQLPSLPSVYAELQKKIQDPECAIGDVAAIIEKDMAMSVKVLQLVNSAFFGMYENVTSPVRAVNLLGLDTVKALVLGVGVFSKLKTAPSKIFSVGALWNHSMMTAALAKKIALAETDDKLFIDTVFIAGIMHDVGKLLLFSSLQNSYLTAVALAREQHLPLCQAEQNVFHSDHGAVGGYLMGLWGFPSIVVESIAFHHRLDAYPEPSFSPAVVIHAADVIYYQLFPEMSVGAAPVLNREYLEQAGLDGNYEQWQDICREMRK